MINNAELLQIVPEEYLHFKEDNYSFGYNGKEYGFYVKHRQVGNSVQGYAKLIDVIIIDFEYTYNDTVYTIKSKLLIQETFVYSNQNGNWQWLRLTDKGVVTDKNNNISGEFRKTYYISQPSFMTMIQNENESNYGEIGYNKQSDNGAIIYQTRLNYQGIHLVDDGITGEEGKAIAKGALSLCSSVFNEIIGDIPVVGDVFSMTSLIGDLVDFVATTADAFSVKEVEVPCNRESDIFQEQSKNTQRNSSQPSYSKVSLVSTMNDLLIPINNDGFVSCTILLNDSGCATRINQIFEYSLMSSNYMDATKNLESEKTNDGEFGPFYAYKRDILFKNASDSSVSESGTMDYYLLEGGEQTFFFCPKYSGEYIISSGNVDVNVLVGGNEVANDEKVLLYSDRLYSIILRSQIKHSGIGNIRVSEFSNKTVTVNSNYIAKFIPTQSGVYTFDGNGCEVTVYNAQKRILEQANVASAQLAKNQPYYIVYKNTFSSGVAVNLSAKQESVVTINSNTKTPINCIANKTQYYKFAIDVKNEYDFVFSGLSGNTTVNIELYSDETGQKVDLSGSTFGYGYYMMRTSRMEVGKYTLKLRPKQNADIVLEYYVYERNYKWILDGKEVKNGDCITRGVTHNFEIRDKNNNKLTNRYLKVGADYLDYVEFDVVTSKLSILETANLYNDSLNVNPHLELRLYDGFEDGISLCVVNNLEPIQLNKISLTDWNNVGFQIKSFLKEGQQATVYYSYSYDGGNKLYANASIAYSKFIDHYVYLESFKNDAKNIIFEIVYMDIKNDSNSSADRIYNKRLYSEYKNVVNINSVVSGIHFDGGTGSADNPYVISNISQYNQIPWTIQSQTNEITASFILNPVNFWGANVAPVFDCTFNGTLEGSGRTVSFEAGLDPLPNGDMAMFRKIGSKGVIKNLELYLRFVDSIKSSENSVGGIAIENYGRIENSKISGSFRSSQTYYGKYVGGIVARNYGIIKNCRNDASVDGGGYVGAVAGYSQGQIIGCTIESSVLYLTKYTDNDYIGGIVGYCDNGEISNCTYTGEICITNKNWDSRTYRPYVGGICGARKSAVKFSGNVMKGSLNVDNLNPDVNWLHWFKRKHFNQRAYVNDLGNVI